MPTVHYYLQSTIKDDRQVSIWVRLYLAKSETTDRKAIMVRANTTLKTSACCWDTKREIIEVNKCSDDTMRNLCKSVNDDLVNMSGLFMKFMSEHMTISQNDATAIITDYVNANAAATVQIPKDMIKYLEWRIQGMKNGTILNNGKRYADNTVKQYGNLRTLLLRFVPAFRSRFNVGVNPSWESFENREMADFFITFLSGYRVRTKNKYIQQLKDLMNFAIEDKIIAPSGLQTRGKNGEKKDTTIGAKRLYLLNENTEENKELAQHPYMTEAEIQALFEMELSGTKAIVRDIFCCCCYTGQRISDVIRITPKMFFTTELGNHVIKLQQVKTRNYITVPVLSANLETIIARYPEGLPKISDVVVNRYIKDILAELSASVPSLGEMRKCYLTMKDKALETGGKTEFDRLDDGTVIRPKYELVTTHCGRRSCITNLYRRHIFSDEQIMSVSGHNDRRTYLTYVSLSSDEIADEIMAKLEAEKKEKERKGRF